MPVEFPRQHDDEIEESPRAAEAMREAMAVAWKSAAGCLALGGVVFVVLIYFMNSAVLAADGEIRHGGLKSGVGPAFMFAVFGLLYGAFVGWRITSTSGLIGPPAWRVGAAAVLLLAVVGAAAFLAFGTGAVPTMGWACIGSAVLIAMPALTYFTVWAG